MNDDVSGASKPLGCITSDLHQAAETVKLVAHKAHEGSVAKRLFNLVPYDSGLTSELILHTGHATSA